MDRGIDYTHPDCQNADGTTRILGVLDLSTDEGANDPDNPYGVGTVHTETEINAALQSGNLITRDAVGHGTVTAGIAAGNGAASDGRILGVAPNASIVVVKFTSEGAAAHSGQPAESPFFRPETLEPAIQFVEDIATNRNMPYVLAANFGSVGGPMDGSSAACRTINSFYGSGVPGRVFLTGSSDDGDIENHALVELSPNQTSELRINKGAAGNLRFSAWYDNQDEITVTVTLPDGSSIDYPPPASNSERVQDIQPTYQFFHNCSNVDFFEAESNRNEVLIDFFSNQGEYTISFTSGNIRNGRIDAWLNPSNIFSVTQNLFLNNVDSGYTVWDWATASSNIGFNSYLFNIGYRDINGAFRQGIAGNEAGEGNLWPGSGVGPVLDGATGNMGYGIPWTFCY